jgi:hypothetical protein
MLIIRNLIIWLIGTLILISGLFFTDTKWLFKLITVIGVSFVIIAAYFIELDRLQFEDEIPKSRLIYQIVLGLFFVLISVVTSHNNIMVSISSLLIVTLLARYWMKVSLFGQTLYETKLQGWNLTLVLHLRIIVYGLITFSIYGYIFAHLKI